MITYRLPAWIAAPLCGRCVRGSQAADSDSVCAAGCAGRDPGCAMRLSA